MQISEKKFKLKMLSEKIQVQESKNEELRDFSENRDTKNIDYIKQIARESLDLSENNEKVFINVSGN